MGNSLSHLAASKGVATFLCNLAKDDMFQGCMVLNNITKWSTCHFYSLAKSKKNDLCSYKCKR